MNLRILTSSSEDYSTVVKSYRQTFCKQIKIIDDTTFERTLASKMQTPPMFNVFWSATLLQGKKQKTIFVSREWNREPSHVEVNDNNR